MVDLDSEEIASTSAKPYCMAELTIIASGFLWHQIRCIMALLYEVGKSRETPEVSAISELSALFLHI